MLKTIPKHEFPGDESAYMFAALRAGVDAGKLTRELVSRHPDDPSSVNRLVDTASAGLWLSEGAPIADVLTMLEVRHRFHLSSADCRAYATEILWAAQHQIEACKPKPIPDRKEHDHAVA
jgi:hypothetical protein